MTSNAQRLGTALVAGILAIGTAQTVTSAIAEAHSVCDAHGYTADQLYSPDNPDCLPGSVCYEDEPCWSCVDDGNRVCGPTNTEGHPAGCYDDGGVLEYVWPCNAWKPADGYVHGDGTVTFPDGHVSVPTGDDERAR